MAKPFDSLAKEILDVLLHDLGRLETEVDVPALVSQRADLFFVPDPLRDEERRALGLLGRITAMAALLEPFHEAPSVEEVLACVRKTLNHRHALLLAKRPAAERAWLLCGGRPDAAFRVLGAVPAPGWPSGVYHLSAGMPVSFVVLSELEETDDTLSLRLMGSGATLASALRTLRERYGVLPRGRALFAEVVQVFLAARKRGERLTEEFMVDLTEAYEYMDRQHEEGLRKGIQKGREEGREEGARALLTRLTELKLARPLTDAARAVMLHRVELDGVEGVGEALVSLDRDALAAWLAATRG